MTSTPRRTNNPRTISSTARRTTSTNARVNWATDGPLVEGVSDRHFEDVNEAPVNNEPMPEFGVASHALDENAATRLWELSLDATR